MKHIGGILAVMALMLIASACQVEQVAQDTGAVEKGIDEGSGNDGSVEETPFGPAPVVALDKGSDQQGFETPKKQTKKECHDSWDPILEQDNPLLKLEQGMVMVTFEEKVTLDEARAVLKKYDVREEEIVKVLPFGTDDMSNTEIFDTYHQIKVSTKNGREVDVACDILEDVKIASASPSVTFDLQELIKNQQK